jgi:hypothetical protein
MVGTASGQAAADCGFVPERRRSVNRCPWAATRRSATVNGGAQRTTKPQVDSTQQASLASVPYTAWKTSELRCSGVC